MSGELRLHGESYGWETQFFEQDSPNSLSDDPGTIQSRPRSAAASGPERAPARVEREWHTIRLMKTTRQLTAIIEREDDAYVALCPELDVASQGDTVESARTNLIEALELFFESADPTEVARRLHGEVFVTRVEVLVG